MKSLLLKAIAVACMLTLLVSCSHGAKEESVFIHNIEITKKYDAGTLFSEREFIKDTFTDEFSGRSMPYRLHLPDDYSEDGNYPILLLLHGAGATGSDNERQLQSFLKCFDTASDMLANTIVICPQTPYSWSLGEEKKGYLGVAKRIVDFAIENYNGDSERIYAMGVSMGSFATWDLIDGYPGFFSAVVPICGGAGDYASEAIADTPIWMYHSTDDDTVAYSTSKDTYDAIKAIGGNKVRLTTLEGVGHGAWDTAFADREMFSWMFAQNSKNKDEADYKVEKILEIVSPDGKAIIDEEGIDTCAYYLSDDANYMELRLSKAASERLSKAFEDDSKAVFGFKIYGKNVYDFRLPSYNEGDKLIIVDTFDNDTFEQIYKRISV